MRALLLSTLVSLGAETGDCDAPEFSDVDALAQAFTGCNQYSNGLEAVASDCFDEQGKYRRSRSATLSPKLFRNHREKRIERHVDAVFPLAKAARAHRHVQARKNVGKVVLECEA